MKLCLRFLFALAITVPMLPASTGAHFILVEPSSWIQENQLGDPQKVGPCGGEPGGDNAQILTGTITEVTGGSNLHLNIQETMRSRDRAYGDTAECCRRTTFVAGDVPGGVDQQFIAGNTMNTQTHLIRLGSRTGKYSGFFSQHFSHH